MSQKNEKDQLVYEQEVHYTPPPRKGILKSPLPTYVLFAASAALFLSVGAAFAWIWHHRTAALSYTSDTDRPILPGHWVATWTGAQQAVDPEALPISFDDEDGLLSNTTIRQTFQLSIGGDRLRLRFSNAFASTPLRIESVTIALPDPERGGNRTSGTARVRLDTLVPLTFSGARGVTIPPHGLAVSDVVGFKIGVQEVVTLSMFLSGQASEALAGHRISRTTSWFAKGDATASYTLRGLADAQTQSTPEWLVVSAVETWQSIDHHAVAMVGDSITDGRSATLNANTRYPDFLFHRLQRTGDAQLKALSILNLGIGGNQVLHDGLGPNLVSRLDRDVLAISGVKYAMVLEGTNDIGHARGRTLEDQMKVVDDMIVQLRQVVTRLHAAGIAAFGGTVLPFACTDGLDPNNHANDPIKEQLRLKLNDWIRNSGAFDAVVDFDMRLRDPNNHTEMATQFRSDDCEHPSDAGYREMAEEFPLDIFARFKDGLQYYP